jgi:hypothetical protein
MDVKRGKRAKRKGELGDVKGGLGETKSELGKIIWLFIFPPFFGMQNNPPPMLSLTE